METFELNFNGTSDDGQSYGCGMRISGDEKIIGRMFAEYAIGEMKNGHPQPMEILISAFENMRRINPGDGETRKIIAPLFQ